MSKEYTIEAVSEKTKNWSSQYGGFTTYYVKLNGEGDEAIQLNKKSDSPAPNSGDELYGEIQITEFGKKFKSQKKPFGSNARTPESQDTQDNIARSVALKAAVDLSVGFLSAGGKAETASVLETADTLLTWLQNTGSQSSSPAVPTPSGTKETQEEKTQPARDYVSEEEIPPEFR